MKLLKSLFFKFFLYLFLTFFCASLLWVIAYRYLNPPTTWLICKRVSECQSKQNGCKISQEWLPLDSIPQDMTNAVMAAEDNSFFQHYGFDFEAIKSAYKKNSTGRKLAGASTISQQTAKNVFLWSNRSWTRKALETYFTILIELFWSKHRIMEIYLNEVELGDKIYGVDAASRLYFHKPVTKISLSEAVELSSILPNPIKGQFNIHTPYLLRRQQLILKNMCLSGWVPAKQDSICEFCYF